MDKCEVSLISFYGTISFPEETINCIFGVNFSISVFMREKRQKPERNNNKIC